MYSWFVDEALWVKFDLGLTLAGWDRTEFLRWLLRLHDWVAVDHFVRRLYTHEKITLDQLQQALSSNKGADCEVKDGKDTVLANSLTSAMEYALKSGK